MSKPLIANVQRQSESAKFHRDVFREFGGPKRLCALCGKPGATDAAHVVPRAKLGPLRYALVQFARPAHRECHEAVDSGRKRWPLWILRSAIRAHNKIAKEKLVVP